MKQLQNSGNKVMRLKDKVVVITGGAQGIGEACARLFVSEGAKVALIDRQEELLKNLTAELGGEHCYFTLDITDQEAVKNSVKSIIENYGRIDILINNAGITRDSLTIKMTDSAWDDVIDINLKAPFVMTREILPHMQEKNQGVILNASSVSSLGNIGQANYAASKAGIIALTKTWALEFARYNIRVNAIAPGFTETTLISSVPDNIREKIIARIPLRRFAQPEEIASAYCFLAGDEAKFITGQVLFVDGGLCCGF